VQTWKNKVAMTQQTDLFLRGMSDTIDVVDYYVLSKDFEESIGLRDCSGMVADFLRKSNVN
jgi:hypothetical protein